MSILVQMAALNKKTVTLAVQPEINKQSLTRTKCRT